jgi:hypothetical protein
MILKLRSEQEQDEAAALQWWRETSNEDKLFVWAAIQALGGGPMEDIISRLAQLGMTHVALMAEGEKP